MPVGRRHVSVPSPPPLELLRWTASLGAVTAEAVALREGISVASARGRLVAACRRGELDLTRVLHDRPSLFTLTPRGARGIGLQGLSRCRITGANANHQIECAWAAAMLERLYPGHRAIGERELRRRERDRDRPLASARMPGSRYEADGLHRPDLVLMAHDGATRPVAVEVELSVKDRRRLCAICRAWARCREVAGVVYLVNSYTRAAVARAVRDANAAQRVAVLELDSLVAQAVRENRRTRGLACSTGESSMPQGGQSCPIRASTASSSSVA